MTKTRLALAGTGDWGSNWLRLLARMAEVELAWVCDLDESRRARAAAIAPHARMTSSIDDALADTELKGVVIATSAPSHAALAEKALLAGKDVLVEKPMTLSSAEADGLARAAKKGGRILMVGHLLIYHPGVEKLKSLIDTGELGDVYYFQSQRVNLGKVRTDENALWSFAPHDIAVALYLFGETPVDVAARGGSFLQAGIEDVVFLTMRFPGGRMAHVHVSWLDPHKIRRITLVGARKMAVFDDMEPSEKIRIHDKSIQAAGHVPFEQSLAVRSGDILIPRIGGGEPLEKECRHFLECIETRQEPRTGGAHGALSIQILEAAQASLKKNGAPVELAAFQEV